MSESAENQRLDAFTRVAARYIANPPTNAVASLTDGPRAAAHYAKLDWYLGYCRDAFEPTTDAEREAVAKVLSCVATADPKGLTGHELLVGTPIGGTGAAEHQRE